VPLQIVKARFEITLRLVTFEDATELDQGHSFDLSGALTSDAENGTHLFERHLLIVGVGIEGPRRLLIQIDRERLERDVLWLGEIRLLADLVDFDSVVALRVERASIVPQPLESAVPVLVLANHTTTLSGIHASTSGTRRPRLFLARDL
jgi:hypothetical protein